MSLGQIPGSNQMLLAEQGGRVYTFEHEEAADEKRLVLDLSSTTQWENDSGLLGFAFHPEFGDEDSENGAFLYVHYAFSASPVAAPEGERAPHTAPTYSRLSRFTVDLDALSIDPLSELDGDVTYPGASTETNQLTACWLAVECDDLAPD